MPTAAQPGVEKTGFVYADAQTLHLAYLLHALLFIYCQTLTPVRNDDLHKIIGIFNTQNLGNLHSRYKSTYSNPYAQYMLTFVKCLKSFYNQQRILCLE